MELRTMTEEQKGVVIAVTQQVINMLWNNTIKGNGTEGFEGWCADGEVFEDESRFGEDRVERCMELVRKVAPLVDELTYKYLNLGH